MHGNFYNQDLSEATIVTLFLSRGANWKLEDKLKQLRPGTRIVSYSHRMVTWQLVKADAEREIYLYKVPGR